MKKRLFGLFCSVLILSIIAINVDVGLLLQSIRSTQAIPFIIALLLFIPQNIVIAGRWKLLAGLFTSMSWGRAIGLVLASHSMNVVLPSKLGDLSKAVFLKNAGALDIEKGINLVIFEKLLDTASLCLLAIVGIVLVAIGVSSINDSSTFWLLASVSGALSLSIIVVVLAIYYVPMKVISKLPFVGKTSKTAGHDRKIPKFIEASREVITLLNRKDAQRGVLLFSSIFLWALHLLQIYFFFIAVNVHLPVLPFGALMPLAIFIGLLPLSLFGMGTRDAAVIFFFSGYAEDSQLAAGALYLGLRYIIPAIAGLPFLYRYIAFGREGANLLMQQKGGGYTE